MLLSTQHFGLRQGWGEVKWEISYHTCTQREGLSGSWPRVKMEGEGLPHLGLS
jgi:hypothetical protein